MTTKKHRLNRLIEFYGQGKPSVFAKLLGIAPSTLSSWLSRDTMDYDLIFAKCENISPAWLLRGEGNMLNDLRGSTEIAIETKPRIPFDAEAGSLSMISNSISHNQCELFPVISRFPTYDFTILVRGDSMEPEFQSGDEIACRFIDERRFIQWGRPHVLDTTQGVVLKRIYNRQNCILCKSDNKDYDDFEIEKQDIFHIALVVGSVRIY